VDKTLLMIGRPIGEVDRLIRLIFEAYGSLESMMLGLPPELLERVTAGGRSVGSLMMDALASARAVAADVRATAESAAAAPA
jgi:hypothetical protein